MNGWKRYLALILTFFLVGLMLPLNQAAAAPSVSAQAAAVIDVDSGRILYQKQGNAKLRIASLTKVMTAIVAIEEGNLQDRITVPDYAVGTEGSSIYLKRGEKLTLENLLYGLMLRSGNDAAVTIADSIGGSIEGFAQLMNEKAEYLGLSGTHFTNPHGLDDSNNHYSSAIDLAKITAYALHNPEFQKIVSTQVKMIPQEGEKWDRKLYNKNKMLRLYDGADGVKTGYTKLAKRCLVSSATRDGRQIAVVTLNAPNDWDDHARLLDYGFQQFKPTQIVGENERVDEQEGLYTVNSFSYPLSQEEEGKIEKKVIKNHAVDKMFPGVVVGYLHIYLGNEEIGKVGLTRKEARTSSHVVQPGLWTHFLQILKLFVLGGIQNG
ncbi:MAG TPA: D-alanyl-D-alanine carboxypeptidase family protein [Bacillota bacterium]|nr:D-alanyl-D-alanine carboxypeptidase family protein [Bacillota bacterium]